MKTHSREKSLNSFFRDVIHTTQIKRLREPKEKISLVTKFYIPVNNCWYFSTAVSYYFLSWQIFFSFCRSEEKIKHFGQLKSELFLKDNTLRKILCLIMELKVTAQKNFILKRLFWKVGVLSYF